MKKGGKVGGQKGHKGTNLKQTTNPDEIVKIPVKGNIPLIFRSEKLLYY